MKEKTGVGDKSILGFTYSLIYISGLVNYTFRQYESENTHVYGKTGEKVVRFCSGTTRAILEYLMVRNMYNGHFDNLWITKKGTALKPYAIETVFKHFSGKARIAVHPHLLRYTFTTLRLKDGGDSLMLQRSLGYTTLMTTNRYCQAVGC